MTSDILWTGAAMLALLFWPLAPLLDALRRPDRAPAPFQVLAPVQTGYSGGAPYVKGARS
jgi:hypothetical protein